MMEEKGLVKRVFRQVIQYLNIFLFICGQVVAVAITVGLNLMIISKRLYLVQDQFAWRTILRAVLAFVVLILLLTIPVHLSARRMKCKIPRLKKGVRSYILAEYVMLIILSIISHVAHVIYVGTLESYDMGHWWVASTKMVSLITVGTTVLCLVQLLLWSVGSDVGDGPYLTFDEQQGDGSESRPHFCSKIFLKFVTDPLPRLFYR